MRRSLVLILRSVCALTAAAFAGAAAACPADDGRQAVAPAAACEAAQPASDRPDCAAESGVIDRLPDSFFLGGGGVGPQIVEAGSQAHIWVQGAGRASASAGAQASASAAVRVSVGAHAHRR